jgi:hypothetical protein
VVQKPSLVHGRGARWRLVGPRSTSRTGCFAIGLPVVLHVARGKIEQRRAGVAFIGEYESRDNR